MGVWDDKHFEACSCRCGQEPLSDTEESDTEESDTEESEEYRAMKEIRACEELLRKQKEAKANATDPSEELRAMKEIRACEELLRKQKKAKAKAKAKANVSDLTLKSSLYKRVVRLLLPILFTLPVLVFSLRTNVSS